MPIQISEATFEEAIECGLLHGGPDACDDTLLQVAERRPTYGEGQPGGYLKRSPEAYDRERCLLPQDLLDFVLATQPKLWKKLKDHHGENAEDKFLTRVAREIRRRGSLHVFRNGVKDAGVRFDLAYFRPPSGLNEELRRLYEGNLFSVVRQLKYSPRNENSLDLVLFLNGLPIFTAELKTQLTGQTVKHAMAQYKRDRDPTEALFRSGRCLAHFAVDPDLVFVTTELEGKATRFLPFNKGKFGAAGNPPVQEGYATAYLWERIWARDSVLNLVQHFIHEVETEDERRKRKKTVIFPRYHQLDTVRRLVEDAKAHDAGERYLIQHSAGSGKSFSIAWLAHQLSILHDDEDELVFDTIVVITDRRVLDRQLQDTVRQLEKTRGLVEPIDQGAKHLKEALESGKRIIVSTLQKFPYIVEEMERLPAQRFAVVIDEAHSSQSGELRKSLKQVLATESLEEAEDEDTLEEDVEDQLVAEMRSRGPQPNVSTFAFTATPKQKTLELFGTERDDGRYEPFSLYSMRQAIEEGFILDVLENYTTYETYWRLLKTARTDPHYDKPKATRLLKNFVELHPHAIQEKVNIVVDHFHDRVAHRIGGKAKAMIVTRSRKHCVRYHRILERTLRDRGLGDDYGALVAFSGTVRDEGMEYTEANLNGIPDSQTKEAFDRPEHRFLVVANKFQTGFDQPLLHTMYVDKKLGGVNAVQTLSRLNRTHPGKEECMVLDFANDAESIRASFEDYYETTILSEGTDPAILYDLQYRLEDFHLFAERELDRFAAAYFTPGTEQSELYNILRPVRERFVELDEDEQTDFGGALQEYVRKYAFLSQLLTFDDAELERLYLFARYLKRYLPVDRESLPREVQDQVDLESLEVRKTRDGALAIDRGGRELKPASEKGRPPKREDELASLSAIIQELNDRFGANLSEKDRKSLEHLERQLTRDAGLEASVKANTKENVRLTFEQKVENHFDEMAESNFKLLKRIVDDRQFGKVLVDRLFERFWRVTREGDPESGLDRSPTEEGGLQDG